MTSKLYSTVNRLSPSKLHRAPSSCIPDMRSLLFTIVRSPVITAAVVTFCGIRVKKASMACASLNFLLLAVTQKYFAYGYVGGSHIWSRNLSTFIPITNVTTFADEREKFLRKSRELETHNFGREALRLAYYEETNIFTFYDNDTKITGVCGEQWNMLSDYLNFTMVINKVKFTSYGSKFPNGSYDGLVGMLQRNEVDIVPRTGYYVTEAKVMDFTTPIWQNRYRTYMRPEFRYDGQWMFHMFSRRVWCSLIFLLIFLAVFGYTVQRISIKVSHDKKMHHNLHDHMFYTFATFCCQGFIPETLYRRTKILSLTKKMLAWLVLMVLSSHLISYMTNQKIMLPFEDLITMFNHTSYNLVVFSGSMIFDKFQRMIINDATEDIKERIKVVNTPYRMYERGCWGKKSVILESEDRQRAYGRFVCKLIPVGRSYFSTWIASGVPKGYKYKRTLDIGILKLNEFGLTDGMKDRWMESAAVTYDASPVNSVNFDQVIMLFMILCIGMIASVAIFVIENVVFIYKLSRRKAAGRILMK